MANRQRGQIPADLNGKKINLILNTSAFCEIEDADGRTINAILAELSDPAKQRFKTVRLVFWGMMLADMPGAKISDADALMDGLAGRHDIVLRDAVAAAFPDAQEGDTSGK
jgi:hypothetical protein